VQHEARIGRWARERMQVASMSAAPAFSSIEDADHFAPMQPQDIDAVMAIENAVYPFPWTRGNFVDGLRSGYCAWVLRAGPGSQPGPLIAYSLVMIAVDEAHLLNLSVDATHQGAGIGWRMLDWMARQSRDHGARSMLLEVRPSNPQAIRLYERYGFQNIGCRRGYYPAQGGREDAIVMRIAL
jgi:ribosomal-protein-alanine N-acetyltransferase